MCHAYGQSDVITTRVSLMYILYTMQRSDTKLTQRGLHWMFIYIRILLYIILYTSCTNAYTHRGVGCDRSCTYLHIYRFVSIE